MARLKGARTRVFNRQPIARDRIWQSIRIMRVFSVPDLMATAECEYSNTMKYVRTLTRFGILSVATKKQEGKKGGHQTWRLARDLGPKAPRAQSDGKLFDPNKHETLEINNG